MTDFLQTSLSLSDLAFLGMGALRTILLTTIAALAGTIIGFCFGLLRAEAGWLVNLLTGAVFDVLRSVPLLIQLIIFSSLASILGFPLSPFACGIIILSLYTAANTTEVARAGILAVPTSIRRSSRSLGMSYVQDLVHIVLPMSMRIALPAWIGVVLAIMKDSALVSVLGYFETLKSAQVLITRTQEPLLILTLVGVIYFAFSYPVSRIAYRIERGLSNDRN